MSSSSPAGAPRIPNRGRPVSRARSVRAAPMLRVPATLLALLLVAGAASARSDDRAASELGTTAHSNDAAGRDDAVVHRDESSLAKSFADDEPPERLEDYGEDLYGVGVLFKTVFSAGFKHIRVSPKQWGGGSTGLNKRLRHSYAKRLVDKSIEHSVAAAFGEVLGYRRSDKKGFWPRTKHAIVSTFVTPREGGGRGLAYSRLAGTTGSYFVANTWYPEGANAKSDALRRSGLSLGLDVGTNILKEFWPDLRKKRSGRKSSKSDRDDDD